MDNLVEQFVILLLEKQVSTVSDLLKAKRTFSKNYKVPFFRVDKLREAYHKLVAKEIIQENSDLEKLLTLKSTRSISGIVVVSVLTKPYPCPGNCIFCPSEKDVPKSYLANEPAVMRAIHCKYDPYLQTKSRIEALEAIGHIADKISVRIIGGTWSYYPVQYQSWFVRRLFEAANGKKTSGLEQAQTVNETAKHRIVELSIETRQDYVNIKEIKRLRKLGITKVELGVQSIDDELLKISNRGHSVKATIDATKMLKDACFKVSYQMMLNLPGSDYKKDLETFEKLFSNPDFKPDHLKIYPLALVKSAKIYKFYKSGKYKPYSESVLVDLLSNIKELIPYYCRVERVIRDIPAKIIIDGGAKISNLRQLVIANLEKQGKNCHCIRCREVKSNAFDKKRMQLFREDYFANDGQEIYLSLESKDRKSLYSMLRLRIPSYNRAIFNSLDNAALVREIHTYGATVAIGENNHTSSQHKGLGKQLMLEVEKIAKEFGKSKIAVIAGVGVREYFRKMGYVLEESYMLKRLDEAIDNVNF